MHVLDGVTSIQLSQATVVTYLKVPNKYALQHCSIIIMTVMKIIIIVS